MRKVSGSRPDGVQDKKEKRKTAQEAWVIWRKKRGGNEVGKKRKEARDEGRAIKSSFIQYLRGLLLSSKTTECIHN